MSEVRKGSLRAYLLAARPKTLSAALAPVLVGMAMAHGDGRFVGVPALLCLCFAALMQVASNFINDYYDFAHGADTGGERLGPARACASGWIQPRSMWIASWVTVGLAVIVGLLMLFYVRNSMPYGGWELVLTGLLCVAFAFLYTTFLASRGLGDLAVVVFFGLVPVCGTYYVQAATLNGDVLAASLACGFAVDALLVVNNYRDRDQDAASGKHTLVVRLGETFGRRQYLGVGVAALVACVWLLASGRITQLEFIYAPCFYFYLHAITWRKMCAIGSGAELNTILGRTSRNILFFGLLLSAALI